MLRQRLSNGTSFAKIYFKNLLIYLDDVIIFGKIFEKMIQNLKRILSRLREVNLKVNPKKCFI